VSRIANFIDGAYFQFMLKEEFATGKDPSGEPIPPKISFAKLAASMAGDIDVLRTYYYDCMPYQSNPPTTAERDRFSKKDKFIYSLSRITRFEVRLGKLEFRGIRKLDGKPIFEQKRVDIQMGVDLVMLAIKNHITHAAVLAGDSDFLPALVAAKQHGVVIKLFHGSCPHEDLLTEVDERTRFTPELINSLLME
jgi:uncharacterized LabA/DUF88 family protein